MTTEMSVQTDSGLEPFMAQETDDKDKPTIKYHILIILLVRIMSDFVFKNPLLFLKDYSADLHLKETQFGMILLWTNVGCIVAVIISDFNERLLKSYQNIMIVHLVIAATGTALFIVPSFYDNELFSLLWCSVCRFIVGVSFSFISAGSIKLATCNISNSGELSNVIATLHYSWALSTILNIPCGYILAYVSWRVVFISMSIMLALGALLIKLIFGRRANQIHAVSVQVNDDYHLQQEDEDEEHDAPQGSGLLTILSHKNSILILVTSCSNGIRSISMYIVIASLWMEDVFNLSEYLVGWTTLTQITAELFAAFLVSLFAYKYKIWMLTFATLVYQFLSNIALLILALVYGNSVGGLPVALAMIFALVMSHQSFYVVSQSISVQYAPTAELSFFLLMMQRMAQEVASVVAILITPMIWEAYFGHAILIFSLLFSLCSVITSLVMAIYRSKPLDYVQETTH